MKPDELRAILAAMAEFDVFDLELPGGVRVQRAKTYPKASEAPAPQELPGVRIPYGPALAIAYDRGTHAADLDEVEAELDRIGA